MKEKLNLASDIALCVLGVVLVFLMVWFYTKMDTSKPDEQIVKEYMLEHYGESNEYEYLITHIGEKRIFIDVYKDGERVSPFNVIFKEDYYDLMTLDGRVWKKNELRIKNN